MGFFPRVKQKILLIQGQTWPNIRKKSSSGERDLWWPSLIRYRIASLTILAAMALPLKIANWNKNQIPSNLCQSRTLIYCQPSWMAIIKVKFFTPWYCISWYKVQFSLNPSCVHSVVLAINWNISFNSIWQVTLSNDRHCYYFPLHFKYIMPAFNK